MPWTTEDSKVVADGLTLFRGAQLAIDTTMVSPLHRDGSARRRAADVDGAALEAARRRKERTYPELAGDGGRARLVVLAAEVGGRWSTETARVQGGQLGEYNWLLMLHRTTTRTTHIGDRTPLGSSPTRFRPPPLVN